MTKLLNVTCGTYCGYPGVPSGIIPRVPRPVTNPSEESLAKLPFGVSLWTAVRKKVTRAAFTAVGPRVLVLLLTNSCARVGESEGKPAPVGPTVTTFTYLASSTVYYHYHLPLTRFFTPTRSP